MKLLDKSMITKVFAIAVLSYYFIKGVLYLAMWQVLVRIEEKSLEAKEMKKAERSAKRERLWKEREEARDKSEYV